VPHSRIDPSSEPESQGVGVIVTVLVLVIMRSQWREEMDRGVVGVSREGKGEERGAEGGKGKRK
jgi:hypothetical protein